MGKEGRGDGVLLTWEGRGSSGFVSASAEQAPGGEATSGKTRRNPPLDGDGSQRPLQWGAKGG